MGSAAAPRVWPGAVEQRSPRAPRPQPQAARGCPVGQTEVVAAPDARTLVSCRSALEAHGVAHDAGLRAPLSLGRSEGREGAEPWTARPRGGSRRARPTRLRSPRPARRARRVPGAGGRLAPCGGAATDPFTLDAPRPSADIDLSCVGPAGRDEMLAGGPTVERPIGGVARPRGLRHLRRAGRPWRQDAHPPRHGSQWGPDHAKVDCNHTNRPPPMPIERRTSPLRPAAMG